MEKQTKIPAHLVERAYYRKDQAYFRRRGDSGRIGVDDILQGGQWVRYDGNTTAPVLFGDRVDPADMPKELLDFGCVYYRLNQAYFRGRAERLPWVDDVLSAGRWEPYEGNPLGPAFFGEQVNEADQPETAPRGSDPA